MRLRALREPEVRYLQFSGVEFFYWLSMAVGAYVVVYLQGLGFSASSVGLISAANSAMGVISTPIWGAVSDKIHSIRRVVMVSLLCFGLAYGVIPLFAQVYVGGMSMLYLMVPLCFFFRQPAMALVDNWVIRASNERGLNYGAIRSYGSLSFAVAGFVLSALLPKTGIVWTFAGCGLLMIPVLVLCLFTRVDAQKQKSVSFRELHLERLMKSYHYVTYLVFCVALNIPVHVAYTFMPYLVQAVGGDTAQMGLITGYQALLEIPMLLLLKPLRRRVPLHFLVVGTAVLFTAEFLLYGLANSLWQLVLISTFHGLGNGLFIASSANYVYLLAPDDLKATAQTFNGAMNSVAGIIGSLGGGILLDMIGVKNFYVAAGVMIFISALYYAGTLVYGKKVLKLSTPGTE